MGQLHDPSTPPDLGGLCVNIIYLLLGIYGWEYVQSLHVEYSFICGRSALRPSLIPYIIGRTCTLLYLLLLAIGTSPYSVLSCPAGPFTIAAMSSIVVGCSSANFLIRTWVIWKDSRLVHGLLLIFALGHWALLVVDVAVFQPSNADGFCVIHYDHVRINAVTLIYTTFLDLLVLVLSVAGLSRQRSESPLKRRLRVQGIVYVAVAGISYIPTMVAALLGVTPVYNLVSTAAVIVSTIVSSRAVRSLLALDTHDPSKDNEVAFTTQIQIQPTTIHEA